MPYAFKNRQPGAFNSLCYRFPIGERKDGVFLSMDDEDRPRDFSVCARPVSPHRHGAVIERRREVLRSRHIGVDPHAGPDLVERIAAS